jgi:hypothetical protein
MREAGDRGPGATDILVELQELIHDMRENGMVIQVRRIGQLDIDALEALVGIAVRAREVLDERGDDGPPPLDALRAAVHRLDESGRS